MTNQTSRLDLPYLQASQADKHVTFNEILSILDGLVMGAIASRTTTQPASNVQSGARYLVPLNPVGDWSGHAGQFAYLQDGTWLFRSPSSGWLLYVEDEQSMVLFDGATWRLIQGPTGPIAQLDRLGIGAMPDGTTPLLAKLNNAAFTARGTGEGGDGTVRLSLNRQDANKTASLIFQTGWQGNAELTLAGASGLSVKVRQSAGNWLTSATFDQNDGKLTLLPSGLSVGTMSIGHGQGNIISNLGIGATTLQSLTTATDSIAIGASALESCTTGTGNVAIGRLALRQTTSGSHNCASGLASMIANSTGSYSCATGNLTLQSNTSGTDNSAFGYASMASNTTGSYNCAFGLFALYSNTTGSFNTSVGRYALSTGATFSNCAALGHNAQVTGSNQVQLGDSATTTYVFGTVQNRSDARDKTDVRDTIHGLDFIRALRPVDFRWDLRDDYCQLIFDGDATANHSPSSISKPSRPMVKKRKRDGTKARTRFHSGLIAQEVQSVIQAQNVDFGGLQDHSLTGGGDIMTLGYDEFIAPLIKSIQQLANEVDLLKAFQGKP
jgi:hypothetical protein